MRSNAVALPSTMTSRRDLDASLSLAMASLSLPSGMPPAMFSSSPFHPIAQRRGLRSRLGHGVSCRVTTACCDRNAFLEPGRSKRQRPCCLRSQTLCDSGVRPDDRDFRLKISRENFGGLSVGFRQCSSGNYADISIRYHDKAIERSRFDLIRMRPDAASPLSPDII
jgi:hypothetical protein